MAHRAGNPHTSRHAEPVVAGRADHTSDLAVTDPQQSHEEMDHANATFHQLNQNSTDPSEVTGLRPLPPRPRRRRKAYEWS